MATVIISGKTYPASQWLKELGFAWDAASKTWRGDSEMLAELERTSTATYSRVNAKLAGGLTIEVV